MYFLTIVLTSILAATVLCVAITIDINERAANIRAFDVYQVHAAFSLRILNLCS